VGSPEKGEKVNIHGEELEPGSKLYCADAHSAQSRLTYTRKNSLHCNPGLLDRVLVVLNHNGTLVEEWSVNT
jgi:hypothetical protein